MGIWQYNYGPMRSDELYHHGVKGQKWGVRRYQNEDGSLTPAGKVRYYKTIGLIKSVNYQNDVAKADILKYRGSNTSKSKAKAEVSKNKIASEVENNMEANRIKGKAAVGQILSGALGAGLAVGVMGLGLYATLQTGVDFMPQAASIAPILGLPVGATGVAIGEVVKARAEIGRQAVQRLLDKDYTYAMNELDKK